MSISEIPPINISFLLKKYGLRPHKGLGQNFLQDPIALEQVVSAAEIQPTDTVLEIGPGLGSLTRYLAASAKEVVAIELDQHLFPPLKAILAPYPNVHLIHGDILGRTFRITLHPRSYVICWKANRSPAALYLRFKEKLLNASVKNQEI